MPAVSALEIIRDPRYIRRFYGRVQAVDSGCWEWQGARNGDGYGVVRVGYQIALAHRVAMAIQACELVADDAQVDHLCFNQPCVRPEHLEVVSREVNYNRYLAKVGQRSSLRITPNGKVQVLWREYVDGQMKQRGRSFGTPEAAEAFRVELAS